VPKAQVVNQQLIGTRVSASKLFACRFTDETFDVGQDTRTGVALVEYRYDVPFKFTGKINKLTFKIEPEKEPNAKR
jgi:hypothetical protein